MLKRLFAFVLFALAVGLTTLAPPPGRVEAARRKGTFVYVHDATTPNALLAFAWAKDGTMAELEGSPFGTGLLRTGCGGLCQTLAYSKKRKALIAGGGDGLSVLFVQKDGSLVLGAGSPLVLSAGGSAFNGVAAVDRGKSTFLYVNQYGTDQVRGFSLGTDGMLTELPGSPWPTGSGPDGILGTKKALFVMNENDDSISSFGVGPDGALTEAPGSPLTFATDFSWNLHLGRKGRSLFTGEYAGADVFGFAFHKKTGELTPLPASPSTTTLTDTGSGLSAPRKGHAVVLPASEPGRAFLAVKVGKDGSLTPVGDPQQPIPTGSAGHGRSPNGKFLVVANNDGAFSIAVDKKTGAMTLVDSAERELGSVNDLHVVRR